MKDEIEALIIAKSKNLPLGIQQYLHVLLHQIIVNKLQDKTPFDQVNLILSFINFTCEDSGDDGYILGIKYSQSTGSEESFPMWKIVWSDKKVTQESKRIHDIIYWIFDRHVLKELKVNRPKYFSRCQEIKVDFTELNGQSISIPVRDIIYLSAEGDFTMVFHGHKKELKSNLVDLSMRGAEILMKPFCFHRIHRSYMVNLGCIRHIHTINSLVSVVLCSGDVLPVARRRKTALIESFIPLRSRFDSLMEKDS
jgi:hypothetical protein